MNTLNRKAAATAAAAALVALVGAAVAGCSGGGGDDGIGNAAVDALLPSLEGSMLSGSADLSAAVTSGTVSNPLAAETDSTQTVTLGSGDDGTAASVQVTVDATHASNGGSTVAVTVKESGSTHVFLDATVETHPPQIDFRTPPLAFVDLDLTGSGRAFVIARVIQSGTLTRTLANTSAATGDTLVAVAAAPGLTDGTASGAFLSYQDFLLQLVIDQGTARVEEIETLSRASRFVRDGGPTVTQLALDVSSFAVAGAQYDANRDLSIPVGNDVVSGGAAADAALSLTASVVGGVANGKLETDVVGDIAGTVAGSTLTTITHATQLAGITIDDGEIDVDAEVKIDSKSWEDPTPSGSISHTLDGALSALDDMEAALYLPSFTETARVVPLWH